MPIRNLRVVVLGMSHAYSRTPLRALCHRTNVVGIIESAPAGYIPPAANAPLYKSPLHGFAARRRIPYFCMLPKGERPLAFLQNLRPDVLCIVGLSRILRKSEFEIAPLGAINFHPSLLPKYRGPRPFLWQAYQADLTGGVTVHQVDDGIDTGDILVQKSFPIRPGDSHFQIRSRSLELGSAALIEALQLLASNRAQPRPQRHLSCPLYARQAHWTQSIIDWHNWPIPRLWHFLRSTQEESPWLRPPPSLQGWWKIGHIDRTLPTEPPGTIAQDSDGYFAAHAQGKIRLTHIPPPNGLMRLVYRADRKIAWW